MSTIHIARDHRPLGEFPETEVAEGLKSGRFLLTDLGWREPMGSWRPLAEFAGLTEDPEDHVEQPPPLPIESVVVPAGEVEPAWERREKIGIISAITQTVTLVFSEPVRMFSSMKTDGGLGSPVAFNLIVGTITMWFAIAYNLAVSLVNPEAVPAPLASRGTQFIIFTHIGQVFLAPLLVVFLSFVFSAVFHAGLKLLGVANKPFEATFRVYCYGVGSISVLQLIPLCGSIMMFFGMMVILIIGLRYVHGTDVLRAAASVIGPSIFVFGLMLALYLYSMKIAMGVVG